VDIAFARASPGYDRKNLSLADTQRQSIDGPGRRFSGDDAPIAVSTP
jgi:hypothetical protein